MFECVIMSYLWIKSHVHARIKHKIIAIESNKCHRTNDELKIIVSFCMQKRCLFFCLSLSPILFNFFFSFSFLFAYTFSIMDVSVAFQIAMCHEKLQEKCALLCINMIKNIIKRQTSGRWRLHTENTIES